MKLPNRKSAKVANEKLAGYLLSESHPIGKSKAKFFKKHGFDLTNTEKLTAELINIAWNNEISGIKETIYGVNYVIEGIVTAPKGESFKVKTIWFVESGNEMPRLVTVIPDIIKGK